jgi:hypothetical protein
MISGGPEQAAAELVQVLRSEVRVI